MAIAVANGERIPLHLTLESRDTTKFVRATIRDDTGAEEIGSPITIPHLADGNYFSDDFFMPNKPSVVVRYEIFDDALFTIPSDENLPVDERFMRDDLDTIVGDIGDVIDQLKTTALRPELVAFLIEGDQLTGIVEETNEVATIQDTGLVAHIDESDSLTGSTQDSELIATIEDC